MIPVSSINLAAERERGTASAEQIAHFLSRFVEVSSHPIAQSGRRLVMQHPPSDSFMAGYLLQMIPDDEDPREFVAWLFSGPAANEDAFALQALFGAGVFETSAAQPGVIAHNLQAAQVFGRLAERGDARAQSILGGLYAEGKGGVPQDFVEAARLWRLAAAQGHAMAREALAKLSSERMYVSACCMGCGASRATLKLKTCKNCKVARFCGAECVRRSWAEHKPHCKRWEALRRAAEGP